MGPPPLEGPDLPGQALKGNYSQAAWAPSSSWVAVKEPRSSQQRFIQVGSINHIGILILVYGTYLD